MIMGLDKHSEQLVGSIGYDEDESAIDKFLASPYTDWIYSAKRVTPYAEELEALEGETGVLYEDIEIDVPVDRKYTRGNNILTPGRNYNLFKDYNFNEIVELVKEACASPDRTAQGINHGYKHTLMICTVA